MAPHAPEPADAAPAVEAGMKRPPSPPPRDAFGPPGVEVAEKGAGAGEEEVSGEVLPLPCASGGAMAMTGPPHGRRDLTRDV